MFSSLFSLFLTPPPPPFCRLSFRHSPSFWEVLSINFPLIYSFFSLFFPLQVRSNLHLVLCFSPVGDAFRIRARKFPGLINCTVMDFFHGCDLHPLPYQPCFSPSLSPLSPSRSIPITPVTNMIPHRPLPRDVLALSLLFDSISLKFVPCVLCVSSSWPRQALETVAARFLEKIDIPDALRPTVSVHMALVHSSVIELSDMYRKQERRYVRCPLCSVLYALCSGVVYTCCLALVLCEF